MMCNQNNMEAARNYTEFYIYFWVLGCPIQFSLLKPNSYEESGSCAMCIYTFVEHPAVNEEAQ